jgi:hypothetical protein
VGLFQKVWGFFKLFPDKLRFFSEVWDILKDCEAFRRHFQKNGGSYLEMWSFYKDFNYFWRLFQRNWGFLRIARLFKYILSEIEAFLKWWESVMDCPRGFLVLVRPCLSQWFPLWTQWFYDFWVARLLWSYSKE